MSVLKCVATCLCNSEQHFVCPHVPLCLPLVWEHVCICTSKCMDLCTWMHLYVWLCLCVCMCNCVWGCVCVCAHMRIPVWVCALSVCVCCTAVCSWIGRRLDKHQIIDTFFSGKTGILLPFLTVCVFNNDHVLFIKIWKYFKNIVEFHNLKKNEKNLPADPRCLQGSSLPRAPTCDCICPTRLRTKAPEDRASPQPRGMDQSKHAISLKSCVLSLNVRQLYIPCPPPFMCMYMFILVLSPKSWVKGPQKGSPSHSLSQLLFASCGGCWANRTWNRGECVTTAPVEALGRSVGRGSHLSHFKSTYTRLGQVPCVSYHTDSPSKPFSLVLLLFSHHREDTEASRD